MHTKFIISVVLAVLLSACVKEQTQMAKLNEPAAKFNPKAAKINTQLGLAYLEQGNTTRAKKKLLLAMKQNTRSPEVNAGMAYFLEQTGNPLQAEQYFQRAVRLAPKKGAPLNNFGAYLCRQGQYDRAISYFMKAVKDNQYVASADAWENAGLCALKAKLPVDAKRYFSTALERDPMRAKSLYHMAQISFKVGAFQQANQYLMRYKNIVPMNARTALLGYKITSGLGKPQHAEDYALLLSQQYPNTHEFKQLRQLEQS